MSLRWLRNDPCALKVTACKRRVEKGATADSARVQRRVQQITVPATRLARARAVALTTARPSGSIWTPAHSVAQSLPLVVVLLLLLLSPLPSPLPPLPSQSPAPWLHPIFAATAKRIRPRRSALVDASAGAAFLTSRLHRSPPVRPNGSAIRIPYSTCRLGPGTHPRNLHRHRQRSPRSPPRLAAGSPRHVVM